MKKITSTQKNNDKTKKMKKITSTQKNLPTIQPKKKRKIMKEKTWKLRCDLEEKIYHNLARNIDTLWFHIFSFIPYDQPLTELRSTSRYVYVLVMSYYVEHRKIRIKNGNFHFY